METSVAYQPLTKAELDASGSIFYGILTNPRIMGTVDDFHLAGIRCAVIVVVKNGALEAVRVREQRAVNKEFPFKEIAGTIESYETEDHVCIVLVRDTTASAVIVGRKQP